MGRTGAFIVIDAMLERIKHEKTVDIYGHVTCLRAQRNYMVQTEVIIFFFFSFKNSCVYKQSIQFLVKQIYLFKLHNCKT